MKHKTSFICALFLFSGLVAPSCLRAEIIDKIAAVVENRIITLSDVQREREIRARLGEPEPENKVLIGEMIDRRLLETEIAEFPNIEVTEAEVDAGLARSRDPGNVPSEALRNAVRFRIRTAKYFDARFRPTIHPSDEDVRKYYSGVFVPEARARGLDPVPPLEEVAGGIQNNVVEEALNREIDIWLEAVRKRSNIEVFE